MKTNRLQRCFAYQLKGFMIPSLVFLGIMLFIDIVLPAAFHLFNGSIIRSDATMPGWQFLSIIYLFAAAIFMFVGGNASFRESFNHLLSMNNTRKNQFVGEQGAVLIVAAVHAVLGTVVGILEYLLRSWFDKTVPFSSGLSDWSILTHLSGMLLFWIIFIAANSLGEIAGILSYRFGRKFILPFWIGFGMAFVIVPIVSSNQQWIADFLAWFVGVNSANPILTAALHLFLTAILLKVISFAFIRKLPQAA